MEPSMEALSVALQHPAISADQRNVCTLLQVSKAWRAAVQQSATGQMDAAVRAPMYVGATCCRDFTDWLLEHASLLRSMALTSADRWDQDTYDAYKFGAQPALELGIQLAAAASTTVAASQQAAHQALALHSFVSTVPLSARTIGHLPAAHLQHLVLHYSHSEARERVGLGTAIQQLSGLQSLELAIGGRLMCSEYVPAIGQLGQLTSLRLSGLILCEDGSNSLGGLPAQLWDLSVQLYWDGYENIAYSSEPEVRGHINLCGVTGLRSFKLLDSANMPEVCALPTQLTSLEMVLSEHSEYLGLLSACGQYKIAALQHLQQLVLKSSGDSPEQLETLTALSQMQGLQLGFTVQNSADWKSVSRVAPIWRRLPNLNSLTVLWHGGPDVPLRSAEELLRDIGAVTSLTSLVALLPTMHLQNPPLDGQKYIYISWVVYLLSRKTVVIYIRLVLPELSFGS